MSKEKKQKGAVVDSVSSPIESEIKDVATKQIDPDLVDFAKDFIVKFAKEYRRQPQCPATTLLEVMKDYRLECEADKNHSQMTAEEIMTDASTLIDLSDALFEDFNKNHDRANESIKAIMRTHVPKLQKDIDVYESMLIEENSKPKE